MIKNFKLFEEQLKLFPTDEFYVLKHKEDFLYHVTNIRNLDSIKKYGILPDFGETVRKFYSDNYIFDEPDHDDEEDPERIPIYKDIKGVSFFAETPLLGFSESGIGINLNWDNIVLCVVEKNNTIFHKLKDDDFGPNVTDFEGDDVDSVGYMSAYNLPIFIEGGDWFSFEEQTPTYILTGEELKKFIKINFPESIEKYKLNENNTSNDIILYHGTKKYFKIDEIEPDKRLSGIYMSTSLSVARDYGYNIFTYKLEKYAKILDLSDGYDLYNWMIKNEILSGGELDDTDLENYIINGRLFQYDISSRTKKCNYIVQESKHQGYDVVKTPDDLSGKGDDIAWIIINKNVLIPLESNNQILESFSLSPEKRWIHYSNVDFLKINTRPVHRDPAGFYMFPDDVLKKIQSYWKSKKFKFILSLKPNLNILNLDKLTKTQELEIINKLSTKNETAFNVYKSYNDNFSFWHYIQDLYSTKPFLARKEFMKIGYDGIYSNSRIHSYEPQLIIFDLKNIKIEKIEKPQSPWDDLIKIKNFILNYLNKFNLEIKIDRHIEKKYDKSKYVGFRISVKKLNKDFSIKIYYLMNDPNNPNIDIHMYINPYTYKNFSMSSTFNFYKPNWKEFKEDTIKQLQTAILEIDL